MDRGTEYVSNSGRHYRDNARAWTPEVPAQARSRGRGAHESPSRAVPRAAVGNTHGHLAGELPAIPAPRQQRGARQAQTDGYQASSGELPLAPSPGAEQDPAPRRTRISFSELEPAARETGQRTDPARAPEQPAAVQDTDDTDADADDTQNGLGMFDLGSVPASVTPPSTWRRAAWFAAASSGGVMGLLFAGTFLLGQQPTQPQAVEHWSYLNRRGGSALFDRDELLNRTNSVPAPGATTVTGTQARQAPPRTSPSGAQDTTGPGSSSVNSTAPHGGAGARPGPTSRTGAAPPPVSGEPSTRSTSRSPTSTPTTTQIPEKPPPGTPQSTVINPKRAVVPAQHDWRDMARVSNAYLNTVTEDPQQALQYTTGELHSKGAEGLRRKYARIAYFEVRKITVNEGEGVTVNTVEVVYKDGSTEMRQVTLTFADNGKISHASR